MTEPQLRYDPATDPAWNVAMAHARNHFAELAKPGTEPQEMGVMLRNSILREAYGAAALWCDQQITRP